MSYRLAFVLGAVVFLLSGCEAPRPIPTPAVDEDAHHTPPEAYGCEVGDPIDNCKWEFPARGGTVTVEAVRRERGLSVTVEDKINGCRSDPWPWIWTPTPAIGGSGESCKDGEINDVARYHCCIITKGTVLRAVSGELRIVGSRYEFPKGVGSGMKTASLCGSDSLKSPRVKVGSSVYLSK